MVELAFETNAGLLPSILPSEEIDTGLRSVYLGDLIALKERIPSIKFGKDFPLSHRPYILTVRSSKHWSFVKRTNKQNKLKLNTLVGQKVVDCDMFKSIVDAFNPRYIEVPCQSVAVAKSFSKAHVFNAHWLKFCMDSFDKERLIVPLNCIDHEQSISTACRILVDHDVSGVAGFSFSTLNYTESVDAACELFERLKEFVGQYPDTLLFYPGTCPPSRLPRLIAAGFNTFVVDPSEQMRKGMILCGAEEISVYTLSNMDKLPAIRECSCPTCAKEHGGAFLHHLYHTHEMLFETLAMQHNIQQVCDLCL
ncbi:hypothetical protein PCE1_002149 [Barthelona sp. PCE]